MNFTIEKTTFNGKEKEYKVVNGTFYHIDTPTIAINALENARITGKRIRIFYGNNETGECWLEEFDIIGHVGRSCGDAKVPILLSNKKSDGGPAILTGSIVRITVDKHNVYKHPKFHIGQMTVKETKDKDYPFSVLVDGGVHANFATEKKATQWIEFMKGERNRAF